MLVQAASSSSARVSAPPRGTGPSILAVSGARAQPRQQRKPLRPATQSESMVCTCRRFGIGLQAPTQARVALQHGGASCSVRASWSDSGASPSRAARSAARTRLAHLGLRPCGERDGNDFFGLGHAREQHQEALDQQTGLAGAGRRLNDERAARIERVGALPGVGNRRARGGCGKACAGSSSSRDSCCSLGDGRRAALQLSSSASASGSVARSSSSSTRRRVCRWQRSQVFG